MAEETPRAPSLRVCRTACVGLMLMTAMTVSVARTGAQAAEGTVLIAPAVVSVEAQQGPFAVSVAAEDLHHIGRVQFDDDRDTEPDREVESIGMGAFEFTIRYDPAVLALAEVRPAADLERAERAFQCLPPLEEKPGSVSFGCVSPGPEPAGPQGDIGLAEVAFEPLAAGATFLLLEAALTGPLGTDSIPVEVRPGAVRVTGRPQPTATLRGATTPEPSNTAAPEQTALPSTTAPLSGEDLTPAAPTALGPGQEGEPGDLAVDNSNVDAEQGRSAARGPSRTSLILWSLAALAGLAAAGAVGLAAVRRRRARA